jgi:hypothetical protein
VPAERERRWFGKVAITGLVFLVDPSWFEGSGQVYWPEPSFRNFVAVALLALLASRPHAHPRERRRGPHRRHSR